MPDARALAVTLACAAALLIGGCAAPGGPQTVTLDEAALQRLVARPFPQERRVLDILMLRVEPPRLRLLPETNRLAAELAVKVGNRLSAREWTGQVALESALRYDEAEHAVRLTQVRVTRFAVDGLGGDAATAANRVGALVAEQALEGLAIHRFTPDDLDRAQRRGLEPGAVTVTSRGVEITLVPVAGPLRR